MTDTSGKNTDAELIRLNRYLAQCGLGARRKCDDLIASGLIFINGKKVTELGTKIRPGVDRVEFRGRELKGIQHKTYLVYNKPKGVVVTKLDPEGRETIYDALKKEGCEAGRLNYVGRLDLNSEGILLLTDDGSLIHALTHPRYRIKKVYQVKLDRPVADDDVRRLLAGVESKGQLLHAGAVRKMMKNEPNWYEIDLYEGKNRQIRRMFETLQYTVRRLKRTQFASIRLGQLMRGKARALTSREVQALKSAGYKNK